MKKNKLILLLGVVLVIATTIHGTMLIPPLLQDRERQQTHDKEAKARIRGSAIAQAAMLSQLAAQDKRIKSLSLSDTERKRVRLEIWRAAHEEMMRIEANDFKEPYNLKVP